MVVEFDKRSYCPVLDEMLKFYLNFESYNTLRYMAKKFVECTDVSFNSILKKKGVWFCVAHFDFDKSLSSDSINGFVDSFDNFVHLVIEEVRYVLGV